ncbi:hypothetical protein [Stackebrandtia nassauensis]|uniref:Uncharacterized protein n=1 Tax=Stackebrandtia nassauensis (strain DSM 44728 / CIP 108903 / NRRL B-16338 / NBRC 102104 / LLR-40K-21) TaxID=446470 RepID=D3Q0L7_STANL|nr:hypothetical protein [Stackebrandtia nassauensis]ADD41753.1 hypothetical protein Snas_2059 [Stackebrandtia nassauensis DSM 44728]
MSQSHSTEEAEPTSGGRTAVLEQAPQLPLDTIAVPDSPATLWTSVSESRITVDCVDCVPAELRDWVAPAVVVHANR